jgi:hypothetical protein
MFYVEADAVISSAGGIRTSEKVPRISAIQVLVLEINDTRYSYVRAFQMGNN